MEHKPSPLRKVEKSPEVIAAFAAMREEREQAERERPAVLSAGMDALKRLLPIAQGNSDQCRYVASFLLGLYNGTRFPFDLTDFRSVDRKIFNDCLAVLKMDYSPQQEVHTYFPDGGCIFEQLAKDWNIPDRRVANNQ